MPEPRSLAGPLVALLLAMVAGGSQPILAVGDTGSSPAATGAPVDLSGHWAAADLGSIDLLQDGTSLRGRSPEGVVIRGTIHGRRATFTFWHGASYRKADKDDRGAGSIDVSPDGRFITVTWESEAGAGKYDGSLTAIRVVPVGSDPDPVAEPDGGDDASGVDGPAVVQGSQNEGVSALDEAVADTGLLGLGSGSAASIAGTVGALAAVVQAASTIDISASELAQYEGYPNLFQAGMTMLQTTPSKDAAAYLSRLAASLKQEHEQLEAEAAEARQAGVAAGRTLESAHDALVAARQDVRLYEWRLGEAQRAAASADDQVTAAGVTLVRAQAAAADATKAAQAVRARWQAAVEAQQVDAAALAAADLEAATDRLAEVEAIVEHDIKAYDSLVLDAEALHWEAELYQRSLEHAVAAVPTAAARKVEAHGDFLIKSTTASLLADAARAAYVRYDQAYWAAVNAWRAVSK